MASFSDLNELLDSEAGEIARKLDADDGSYDGKVDVDILNQFLTENGFKKYNSIDGKDWVSYIDVVKMIYNLKRESLAHGDTKISVDFDPVEELRKARKQYERWR
jgi:hypothetical protein